MIQNLVVKPIYVLVYWSLPDDEQDEVRRRVAPPAVVVSFLREGALRSRDLVDKTVSPSPVES